MNSSHTLTSLTSSLDSTFIDRLRYVTNGPFDERYREFVSCFTEKSLSTQEAFELYVKTRTLSILNPIGSLDSKTQHLQNFATGLIQIGYFLDYAEGVPESFSPGVQSDCHRTLIAILDVYNQSMGPIDIKLTLPDTPSDPLSPCASLHTRALIDSTDDLQSRVQKFSPEETLKVYKKIHSGLYEFCVSELTIHTGNLKDAPSANNQIPEDVLALMSKTTLESSGNHHIERRNMP